MIDEILELGFSEIELSHGMTIAKLPGIQKAFDDGRFTCLGVHNFFPSPVEVMIDAPDAYQFTSHRAHERQRALEMTRRTIELAGRFRAQYVVLHMGSVPLNPSRWTKRLTHKLKEGLRDTPQFAKERIAFIKKREKIGPLYYQRAINVLETLIEEAEKADVILAIESRSRFEDMPTEREMLALQEHFKDIPRIAYWHDFGHVQLKHNLGLLDHNEWLEKMAPFLLGAHVHDVQWPARDHRVPFTGEIRYEPLLRHFPPGCPLTWELSPTRKSAEIRDALTAWKHLFPDR